MIELKYTLLEDNMFRSGLSKICNYTQFPTSILGKVAKIAKELNAVFGEYEKEKEAIKKKWAELDEKGNFQPDPKNPKQILLKADNKLDEELTAFHAGKEGATFKLDAKKLNLSLLEGVGISPNEFCTIEELVHELEAVETEKGE